VELDTRAGRKGSGTPTARGRCLRLVSACLMVFASWSETSAQSSDEAGAPKVVAQDVPSDSASTGEDDAAVLVPAEPDFVVINLPTNMRLPILKGNFRMTHRFAGNLHRGTFGQQASNLFGLDQGATIGFEFRLAVARDVQASFYRSGFDKTIQLHGKYDAVRQRRRVPVSVSALVSIEGTDNFQEKFAPSGGIVVSRTIGSRLAAYVTPLLVGNSAASVTAIGHSHEAAEPDDAAPSHARRNTTFVGLGGRLRLRGGLYVAAEIVPRVNGYAPDDAAYGVSVEKRVGSHMFALTFTNSFGTTFAQVARGGATNTLFLGFNLGRKFY
jgi:hypothetical protein